MIGDGHSQRNTKYPQIYSCTRVYDDTGEIETVKETNAPEPAHTQEDTTDTVRRKRAALASEKDHKKKPQQLDV